MLSFNINWTKRLFLGLFFQYKLTLSHFSVGKFQESVSSRARTYALHSDQSVLDFWKSRSQILWPNKNHRHQQQQQQQLIKKEFRSTRGEMHWFTTDEWKKMNEKERAFESFAVPPVYTVVVVIIQMNVRIFFSHFWNLKSIRCCC